MLKPSTKLAGFVVAIAIALIASDFVPFRRDTHYLDPITGSARIQTTWLGMVTVEKLEVSPLEKRLRVMQYHWTPTWTFMDSVPRTVWGNVTYEDGTVPAICQIKKYLGPFVDHATDAEIRRFADTMRTGTVAEQNAAINAAFDKALAAM